LIHIVIITMIACHVVFNISITMTVISALISEKGTSIASDSLRTVILKEKRTALEWTKSKIISLPKFRGSISYWGFAGTLRSFDEKTKKAIWYWNVHSWLTHKCKNPKEDNVEDFVNNLKEKLNITLKGIRFKNMIDSGIGLHITSYEYIDGFWIPELFLISNYKDESYKDIGTLSYSRNTYKTIAHTQPKPDHRDKLYRLKVKQYLMGGGLIWYNNGDPILYNTVASSIFSSISIAKQRMSLKDFKTLTDTLPLVKRPIEIISTIQRDFYKPDMRIVGGKTHDLAISPHGEYYSTSGGDKI
jgi:hypothetical protein